MLSILGGVLCGIFVGVMPGLSSVMGMSIMLPVALAMDGNMGVLMMLGANRLVTACGEDGLF